MRGLKAKGFTFVEVLASILILAGVITPFILYSADNLTMSMEIERRVKSTLLAEGEMEEIKNRLFKSFDWNDNGSHSHGDYIVTRNMALMDGSLTLKIIGVSVGYDADKNGSLEPDEIMVTLTTQYVDRS